MTKNTPTVSVDITPEERALLVGDLGTLNSEQRSSLYMKVCSSLGLNALTQPFSYIQLNGKLQMYASRNCTDQLRQIHNVSLKITQRERVGDSFMVTAQASMPSGRFDESTGVVTIGHLKGDALANALMKAETKAKRRVTLSICGLSMLDESELETVKDARIVPHESKQDRGPQLTASESRSVINHATGETVPMPTAPPSGPLNDEPDFDPVERVRGALSDYVVPQRFRKWAGRTLEQVGIYEAKRYRDWLKADVKSRGKEPDAVVAEFIERVDEFEALMMHAEPPKFDEHQELPF